jgi:hypothetical protein
MAFVVPNPIELMTRGSTDTDKHGNTSVKTIDTKTNTETHRNRQTQTHIPTRTIDTQTHTT